MKKMEVDSREQRVGSQRTVKKQTKVELLTLIVGNVCWEGGEHRRDPEMMD